MSINKNYLHELMEEIDNLSFDCRLVYDNFIIGGLSYTSSNDISLNVGVQFCDGSKFDGLKTIFS